MEPKIVEQLLEEAVILPNNTNPTSQEQRVWKIALGPLPVKEAQKYMDDLLTEIREKLDRKD